MQFFRELNALHINLLHILRKTFQIDMKLKHLIFFSSDSFLKSFVRKKNIFSLFSYC